MLAFSLIVLLRLGKMMFILLTANHYLSNGFVSMSIDKSVLRCKCKVLIIDTTQPNCLEEIKNINITSVCTIILLVDNVRGMGLFQYITFPCRVFCISLNNSIHVLKSEIEYILNSLASRDSCNYKVFSPDMTRRISRKELQAVRLFFSGVSTFRIADQLFVSNKTILNYIRRSMVKLDLTFSTESLYLFNIFEVLEKFTRTSGESNDENGQCPLRVYYVKLFNQFRCR